MFGGLCFLLNSDAPVMPRELEGRVRVVGVEPGALPTLTMALKAGAPIDAPAGGIAADSLAPRRVGALVYPIAKRHVDHVVVLARRRNHPSTTGPLGDAEGGCPARLSPADMLGDRIGQASRAPHPPLFYG
jgi:hypothetical protein